MSRLNPDDGPIARFAARLRAVHEDASGRPTLTDLATRANYSAAVFSNACRGKALPTWDVTAAFLDACDHPADETWWQNWRDTRADAQKQGTKVPQLPPAVPFGDDIDEPAAPARRRRLALLLAGTAVTVVVGIVVTVLVTPTNDDVSAGPGCDDIGVAHEGIDADRVNRGAWQRAYEAAGGREKLGCPLARPEQGFVHVWGPGLSQDLVDEAKRPTRLMALSVDTVIVMTGTLYEDYTRPHNNAAAGLLGYPLSGPVRCGAAQVVPLDKGDLAPGAMVSTPTGRWTWLPRPVWSRYLQLGGPAGSLGRPRNAFNEDTEGAIEFEDGTMIELQNDKVTVTSGAETTLHASAGTCP